MSNSVIILTSVGIIQSLLFGLLISIKKTKKVSDWILLTWFLTFATHLALILLIYSTDDRMVLILAKTITLLHGSLLLLYTFSAFNQHFSASWLIHLLPAAILTIFSFSISNPHFVNAWELVLLIAKTLSLIGYPIYMLYWLAKRIQFLKTTRADSFIIDSVWVKTLSILILVYAGIGILHVLANVLLGIQFFILLDILFYVAMIMIIGFYGLKFGIVYDPNPPTAPTSEKASYKHSPLKRDEIRVMRERIDTFFNDADEYRDPQFSLSQLSEKLEIKKHHLSEVINLDIGSTFYDMVNAKRVQYAMHRMQEKSETHITLEALGYESGFNTKSAFYHHFKNFSGKTPGQFKSEISPD